MSALNHYGALETRDPIEALSPAEATAKLNSLKLAFDASQRPAVTESTAPAVKAHVELDRLQSDPAWNAKLFAGDAETTAQFRKLNAQLADPDAKASLAMAGIVPQGFVDSGPGLPLRDMVAAAADLLRNGQTEQGVLEILADKKPTREEHEMARRLFTQRFADPEWKARRNAKDPVTVAQSIAMSWGIGCYEAA
jgi:hypothetical protein